MNKRLLIVVMIVAVLSASLASTGRVLATPDSGDDKEVLARSAVGPYETGPGPFTVDGTNIQLTLDKVTEIAVFTAPWLHAALSVGIRIPTWCL